MSEKFAPTVIIDGYTVMPEGWMWVAGLALAGVDWAIKLCDSNLEIKSAGEHSREHRLLDTHRRQRDAAGRFA